MARWKLLVSHYLPVTDEEWEYKETDRSTGREIRKRMQVPRLLDINDPSCWTNKWGTNGNEEGEIIVCHEGRGDSKDIVFIGDPTPDMQPVDDEAREISASFEGRWSYKSDDPTAVGYSQSLVDKFQFEMAQKQSAPVEIPGLSDLTAAIGKLVDQNQKVLESSRRV